MSVDLARTTHALVRGGARPPAAALRGLGAAWRVAEGALLAAGTRRPRDAEPLARAFLRLARASGEAEALGRAARLRASLLARAGRFGASVAWYERAEQSLQGAARDGARIGRAGSLLRLGHFDAAERLAARAERAADARGDDLLAGAAASQRGTALHEGGRPEAALAHYGDARRRLEAAGATQLANGVVGNTANALVLLERFDEAAPLLDLAAAHAEDAGDALEAARWRYNRGALLAATDRLADADAALREAEDALRRAGVPDIAGLARLDRAEALLRARLVPEALHAAESARRAMGRAAPPVERERARLLVARALLELGDVAAARRELSGRALADAPELRAERAALRAALAAARGRDAEAAQLLQRAAGDVGARRPALRARLLLRGALVLLGAGEVSGARRALAAARRAAQVVDLPSLAHAADVVAFLVADAGGRDDEAGAALAAAARSHERAALLLGAGRMRDAARRGLGAWLAPAVRHLLRCDGPDAALAFLDRHVASTAAPAATHDARVESLRARLARLERRAAGELGPAFVRAASAEHVQEAVRDAERELTDALAAAAPVAAAGRTAPRNVAPGALRVPRDTVLVTLSGDAAGGVALVARGARRTAIELASHARIDELVDELAFHAGRAALGPDAAARHAARTEAGMRAALAALAEHFVAPLADVLAGARRLVVVPDGPWFGVPFGALPWGAGPLAARVPVALLDAPSRLGARTPGARGAPVVVAVADASAPHIADEGRGVAAALPGARLLADAAATLDAVRALRRPRVLHLAAHGSFREDAPGMSGVDLADGRLRAADLARLDLRGTRAVLAACHSGALRAHGGGDVEGLTGALLRAGAAEVVAALWRVDDAATVALMLALHARLAAGADAATALAATQAEAARAALPAWTWSPLVAWSTLAK